MKVNTGEVGLGEKTAVGSYSERSKGTFKELAYTHF